MTAKPDRKADTPQTAELSAGDDRPLEGKRALITGASRGIGAEIARAMSRAGASVALAARDAGALDRVRGQIEADGGRAVTVPTDVADRDAVERMVALAIEQLGGLEIAVNNAADVGHPPTPLADIDPEQFRSGLATSLVGVFTCLQREIPAMLACGGGAIVNMASTAGLDGVGGLAAYVAAKHGVVGLTKVAALDYAAAGIRVNAIAPGPILTERLQAAGLDAQELTARAVPMRRIGRPAEVAAAAVWLCSDAASFVTGATLAVDGGRLAGVPPFQG